MTNEKFYQSICEMLQEYDLHTGSRGADGVISAPEKWIGSPFTFYANAAALLIEARARMDTKTTPRTTSAAVGRVLKNAPRDDIRGIFQQSGRFCVCDGFRLLRLQSDITSLPHLDHNAIDSDSVMRNCCPTADVLQLPTVAELRAFISAEKAKAGKKSRPSPYCLGGFIWVNPSYLIDMIQALPGCTASKPDRPISPIYFRAENGDDGILLPCRPPEDKASAKKAA